MSVLESLCIAYDKLMAAEATTASESLRHRLCGLMDEVGEAMSWVEEQEA